MQYLGRTALLARGAMLIARRLVARREDGWHHDPVPDKPSRPACCADDYDLVFDRSEALNDLDEERRAGPPAATRTLLDALHREGISGARVTDVGAGIGSLHLGLLKAGATGALDVDLSQAYLEVARERAEADGFGERVEHRHGDFAEIADDLPEADVVTMDRVICCYTDVGRLLRAAARRSTRLIGLVYPTDLWPVRVMSFVITAFRRLRGSEMPFLIHRQAVVDETLRAGGFLPAYRGGSWFWRVAVYRRAGEAAASTPATG